MFQFDHNEVPFGCPPSQPPPPPQRTIKPVPNVVEGEDEEDEEVVHETLPLTILLKKALKLVNKNYSLK